MMKRITLITAANSWWRFWSVRFDALMYTVMGYFIAYPNELNELVKLMPQALQKPLAFIVPILLFSAKTTSRVVKQPGVAPKQGE